MYVEMVRVGSTIIVLRDALGRVKHQLPETLMTAGCRLNLGQIR